VVRAAETRRRDGLFVDPVAQVFLAAAGISADDAGFDSPDPRRRGTWRHVTIRTRFFDDFSIDVARSCRQIVLLGAGLDSRAYRLPWPESTTIFEIDTDELLGWKQEVLDAAGLIPNCERRTVPADLRSDWLSPLAAAGHILAEPTAWLAEGLLVYLATEVAESMLGALSATSAPGSRLGASLPVANSLARPGLWLLPPQQDPVSWFAPFGWDARTACLSELAADYGRPGWLDSRSPSFVDARRQ
jgi:methyltransferase (TIGR00027 family)